MGLVQHLFYMILVVDIVLGVLPGLHYLSSIGAKLLSGSRDISVNKIFVNYSLAYIPLGLMLWAGFNFSLIMIEWSYIPIVVSDPFGVGWNLIGATHTSWFPISVPIPIVEILFMLLGVFLSLKVGYNVMSKTFPNKNQAIRALIPFAVFTAIIAIVNLWFYVESDEI